MQPFATAKEASLIRRRRTFSSLHFAAASATLANKGGSLARVRSLHRLQQRRGWPMRLMRLHQHPAEQPPTDPCDTLSCIVQSPLSDHTQCLLPSSVTSRLAVLSSLRRARPPASSRHRRGHRPQQGKWIHRAFDIASSSTQRHQIGSSTERHTTVLKQRGKEEGAEAVGKWHCQSSEGIKPAVRMSPAKQPAKPAVSGVEGWHVGTLATSDVDDDDRMIRCRTLVALKHQTDSFLLYDPLLLTRQAIIDSPTTGVSRQAFPFKHLTLTKLSVPGLPRGAGSTAVKKFFDRAGVAEKWSQSGWAKKRAAVKTRRSLSDFDRFNVMLLKKQRRNVLSPAVKKAWPKRRDPVPLVAVLIRSLLSSSISPIHARLHSRHLLPVPSSRR